MEYLNEFKMILEVVALIGTAIWVVFSLQSTTGKLSNSMEHLTKAVEKLDAKMETSRGDIWGLSGRITKIEAELEAVRPRSLRVQKGDFV
jgi:prefoldin subunit 5